MSFQLLYSQPSRSTIFIRLSVSFIFISEGMQKLLLPELRGAGRIRDLNIPAANFFGSFIGVTEVICGTLILAGFITRIAVVPLIFIIVSAFAIIKADVFVNEGFLGFIHDSCIDWAMFCSCLFLLVKGGGKWSLDNLITKR